MILASSPGGTGTAAGAFCARTGVAASPRAQMRKEIQAIVIFFIDRCRRQAGLVYPILIFAFLADKSLTTRRRQATRLPRPVAMNP